MDFYKLHSKPESLDHYDMAQDRVVDIFWNKYENNPKELKKREKAIALSSEYSYKYACDVLKGHFKLGEKAIAKDAEYSYQYALYVLKGPFKLGEAVIAKNAQTSYLYNYFVLKKSFNKSVSAIAKNAQTSYLYVFLWALFSLSFFLYEIYS